jgi:hypothetical protein
MKMISIGPVEGNAWLFGRKLERVLAEWQEPVKLALVYLPIQARHEEFLATIADATGAPVIGASTGGIAFTERGASKTGAVCALIGGEVDVRCALARDLRADPVKSLRSALADLDESVPSGPRSAAWSSLLVLADALACDGEDLVAAIRQGATPHTRIFGGTAGDDWTFKGTKIFYGRKVVSDAAVITRLTHRQRLNIDVLHGFRPADEGREFTITAIAGNVLQTLDGQPAATVYEDELRRLGLLKPGEQLLLVMATHELGVRTPFGEELKIRAPLGVGSDGSIMLASSLSKGQVVRVVTTSPDRLIQSARTLSSRTLGSLPAVSGVLVFDCAARLRLLGDRYGEEVLAFKGAGEHPMIGMACYGEIAKFGGNVEGFHNTTSVMVAW